MKISDVNVEARVDELILSQYTDSENLKNYIKCFVEPTQPLFTALDVSQKTRQINYAFGDSLDKIARTVGEYRIIRGAKALGYFGFDLDVTALPLNEGVFFSYGDEPTGDLVLTDESLRRLIRARIVRNISGGRIEDVITYTELLVGRPLDIELKEGSASIDLKIKETLNTSEKLLLSIRMYGIVSIGVKLTLSDNAGIIDVQEDIYEASYTK